MYSRLNILKQLGAVPDFLKLLLGSERLKEMHPLEKVEPLDSLSAEQQEAINRFNEDLKYRRETSSKDIFEKGVADVFSKLRGKTGLNIQDPRQYIPPFYHQPPFRETVPPPPFKEPISHEEFVRRVELSQSDPRRRRLVDEYIKMKEWQDKFQKKRDVHLLKTVRSDIKESIQEWNKKKEKGKLDPQKTYEATMKVPILTRKRWPVVLDWAYIQMSKGKKFKDLTPPEEWPGIYKYSLNAWQYYMPDIRLENGKLKGY
jgi:hypothetical protein